jgi:hypothetical protein
VKDLIDVAGASGAVYRFRRVSGDALRAAAGNFLYVRDSAGLAIVCCGTSNDLFGAQALRAELVDEYGPVELYIRLNVSSALRAHELGDLCEQHTPRRVAAEL